MASANTSTAAVPGAGPVTMDGSSSGASREARIATHSHIKGLGLSDDGTALSSAQGFVGQKAAREVSHKSRLRDDHSKDSWAATEY